MRQSREEGMIRPEERGPSGVGAYPFLFRLLHWLLSVSLVVLLLSGLSLHAAARPDRSLFSGVVPEYLWSGRVHLWHFVAALVFFPSLLGAILACWRRPVWSQPIHAALFGGGLVMIVTGLLTLSAVGSPALGKTAVWLHGSVGLVLLPLTFLWHAVSGLVRRYHLLIPAFHPYAEPKWIQPVVFLLLALATTWLMIGAWPARLPRRTLTAVRLSAEGVGGSDLASLPWDKAPPLKIKLRNGSAFDEGRTEVTLRAMHDAAELYVMAEWADATENRRYTPWKKRADGWEQLVTNAKDECVYYEDKFALAFPTDRDYRFEQAGCAIYCHAGVANPYGSKSSDRIVDIWHWKATRTDPVGQVDDKHWSSPKSAEKPNGRFGDPSDGGGYEKNAAKEEPRPAFLPDDPSVVRQGMIPREHAVEYEAAEGMPAVSVVPGIVASPFLGDRGDVHCQSQHQEGRWTVYIRRKLTTGSKYDVQFTPAGTYAFGCAAFDHAAKRHAYGWPTYRLHLEK